MKLHVMTYDIHEAVKLDTQFVDVHLHSGET